MDKPVCENFEPDVWKKNSCRNCFRPKSSHDSSAFKEEEESVQKTPPRRPPKKMAIVENASAEGTPPSKGKSRLKAFTRKLKGSGSSQPDEEPRDKKPPSGQPAPAVKTKPVRPKSQAEPVFYVPDLEPDVEERKPRSQTFHGGETQTNGASDDTTQRPEAVEQVRANFPDKRSAGERRTSSDGLAHRTILLLGKTGNGKSTIANVLVGTHNDNADRDLDLSSKEGHFGASETDEPKELIFPVEKLTYKVIDTIGLGDTRQPPSVVLMKLAKACNMVRDGINQILFVTTGRFTEEEEDAFNVMRTILFTPDVWRFITIIRSKSEFFDLPKMCEQDIEHLTSDNAMRKSVQEIFTVGVGCRKIIHVNNPNKFRGSDWAAVRERSRGLLLAWLESCTEVYCPQSLTKMEGRVTEHLEKGQKLEQQIANMENQLKQEQTKYEEVKAQMEAAAREKEKKIEERQRRLEEQAKEKEAQLQDALQKMRSEIDARESAIAKIQVAKAEEAVRLAQEEQRLAAERLREQQEQFMEQQRQLLRSQQEQQREHEEELRAMEEEREDEQQEVLDNMERIWEENFRAQREEVEKEREKLQRMLQEAREDHQQELEKALKQQRDLERAVKEMKGEGVLSFIKRKLWGSK